MRVASEVFTVEEAHVQAVLARPQGRRHGCERASNHVRANKFVPPENESPALPLLLTSGRVKPHENVAAGVQLLASAIR